MPATSSPALPPASPPPPRSTLLFFDNLHGGPGELQRTQIAAERLIKEGLGPSARAAVYAASEGLILDFTADANALTAAIQKLRTHRRVSKGGLMPCPRITPYQAYLIDNNLDHSAPVAAVQEARMCANADPLLAGRAGRSPTDPATASVRAQASATWQQTRADSLTSFDAIDHALGLLARAPGTRGLLMVFTGFLSGTLDADRDASTDRAIRAGIVIKAIDTKGWWSETPGRPWNELPGAFQYSWM